MGVSPGHVSQLITAEATRRDRQEADSGGAEESAEPQSVSLQPNQPTVDDQRLS